MQCTVFADSAGGPWLCWCIQKELQLELVTNLLWCQNILNTAQPPPILVVCTLDIPAGLLVKDGAIIIWREPRYVSLGR